MASTEFPARIIALITLILLVVVVALCVFVYYMYLLYSHGHLPGYAADQPAQDQDQEKQKGRNGGEDPGRHLRNYQQQHLQQQQQLRHQFYVQPSPPHTPPGPQVLPPRAVVSLGRPGTPTGGGRAAGGGAAAALLARPSDKKPTPARSIQLHSAAMHPSSQPDVSQPAAAVVEPGVHTPPLPKPNPNPISTPPLPKPDPASTPPVSKPDPMDGARLMENLTLVDSSDNLHASASPNAPPPKPTLSEALTEAAAKVSKSQVALFAETAESTNPPAKAAPPVPAGVDPKLYEATNEVLGMLGNSGTSSNVSAGDVKTGGTTTRANKSPLVPTEAETSAAAPETLPGNPSPRENGNENGGVAAEEEHRYSQVPELPTLDTLMKRRPRLGSDKSNDAISPIIPNPVPMSALAPTLLDDQPNANMVPPYSNLPHIFPAAVRTQTQASFAGERRRSSDVSARGPISAVQSRRPSMAQSSSPAVPPGSSGARRPSRTNSMLDGKPVVIRRQEDVPQTNDMHGEEHGGSQMEAALPPDSTVVLEYSPQVEPPARGRRPSMGGAPGGTVPRGAPRE